MGFQFARAAWGLLILLGIGQVLLAQENDMSAIIAIRVTLAAPPQAKPELEITEPPAGSIVNPGQALTVKVSSPTPALFSEVALIGDDPIGFAGTISSLPGEITVPIPKDIDLGKRTFTVEGTAKSGGEGIYARIEIDVESPPISNTCTDGKAGAFRLRRDGRAGVRTRWFLPDRSSFPARTRIQQLRCLSVRQRSIYKG